MHNCPLCHEVFNVRELGYSGLFKNHRICPNCDGKIIADRDTRYRQFVFIIISLISLAFTALLYFEGNEWLIPALVTYIVMGLYLWWCTTRVHFVPYEKKKNSK